MNSNKGGYRCSAPHNSFKRYGHYLIARVKLMTGELTISMISRSHA